MGRKENDRATRLRRIVKDGEDLAQIVERLRENLPAFLREQYAGLERGRDRADDKIGDIDRAFDTAAFYAGGQAEHARKQLEQDGRAVRFTRHRSGKDSNVNTDAEPHTGKDFSLWEAFARESNRED